jgi:hypothetical protein
MANFKRNTPSSTVHRSYFSIGEPFKKMNENDTLKNEKHELLF